MNECHYNKEELRQALEGIGVKKGDIVFSHIGMGFLGYPKEGKDLKTMFHIVYNAFREVLGDEGTLIVPTYTYSFCKNEPFDVENTPSTVGYFTEEFRKLSEAIRSIEPIFSVSGIGPKVKELFQDLPMDCFGPDCIYDRLIKADALNCNVGVGFKYSTFVHHVEQTITVPYRYKKIFTGEIIEGNKRRSVEIVYNVRTPMDDESTLPDLTRLERDASLLGYLKSKYVGRGKVTNISCRNIYDLCVDGIKKDPWYLARGKR